MVSTLEFLTGEAGNVGRAVLRVRDRAAAEERRALPFDGHLAAAAVALAVLLSRVWALGDVQIAARDERVVVAARDALVLGRRRERLRLSALVAAGAAVELAPRVPGQGCGLGLGLGLG